MFSNAMRPSLKKLVRHGIPNELRGKVTHQEGEGTESEVNECKRVKESEKERESGRERGGKGKGESVNLYFLT